MIFEFPFDLIVMARTFPRIPDPALYRALFFAPLFLIEITTLSLLTLSPMVKLPKATFFSFAAVLAVFAAWGLFGFGYPSAPLPYALNVLSKILAFVTALSLFLPQRAETSAPHPHPARAPRSREHGAAPHKASDMPLAHLRQGEQLAWYGRHRAGDSPGPDLRPRPERC
jgi:hypothetical protein